MNGEMKGLMLKASKLEKEANSNNGFESCANDIINILQSFKTDESKSKNAEVIRNLMTSLCNIITSDERTEIMLKNEDFFHLLNNYGSCAIESALGARMSCLMTIRNISISPKYKMRICNNQELIDTLLNALKDEGGAINSSALSAIRTLLMNSPSEVTQILEAKGFMPLLVLHGVTKRLVRHPDGRTFWPQIEACRSIVYCLRVPEIAKTLEQLGAAKAMAEFVLGASHQSLLIEGSEGLKNVIKANSSHVIERFGNIVLTAIVALIENDTSVPQSSISAEQANLLSTSAKETFQLLIAEVGREKLEEVAKAASPSLLEKIQKVIIDL